MVKKLKEKVHISAKNISLIAIMAATITGGKMAIAFLPNVEIVTLLCAVYGYVFGLLGICAVFIFVLMEPLIWGFGGWFISYLIYWPLVATVFYLLKKQRVSNKYVLTAIATLLTVFFGALTSLVDIGLFMGSYDNFWYRFSIYYVRGIWFYVTQVVFNIFSFLVLFSPLKRILEKLDKKSKNNDDIEFRYKL